MSLTTPYGITQRHVKALIKNCIPNKEQFYSNDASKCFNTKKKCAVSYELETRLQSSKCGAAFDYLARFVVANKAKSNKNKALKDLTAERFITSCDFSTITIDDKTKKKYEKKNVRLAIPEGILCGVVDIYRYLEKICDIPTDEISKLISKGHIEITTFSGDEKKQLKANLHKEYKKQLTLINRYIHGSAIDENDLIDICIILARMELIRRSGSGVLERAKIFRCDSENSSIKNELKRMLDSFKKTFLPSVNENSDVVYNPHFGIGSRIIGGADADIFIDGILYDFKTSIKNGWSSADVTQITGYFILDAVAKKCNDKRNWLYGHAIEKIALYKVRYEEIAFFNTKDIPSDLLENTIKSIYHTYLMYNFSRLYLDERFENTKIKYAFSLTEDQLRNCTDMNADYLKSLLDDGDKLDEFLKEDRDEIMQAQNAMKNFLDNIDIISFFRELIEIHNDCLEQMETEAKDNN